MRYDIVRIVESPACGREVECEQFFLPADLEPLVESSGGQERLSADDATAREEAENPRAIEIVCLRQWAPRHDFGRGIGGLVASDQDPPCDQPESGVSIEEVGGTGKRSGGPPRVVIAERDVGRSSLSRTHVARRAPGVVRQRQKSHVGKSPPNDVHGVVG